MKKFKNLTLILTLPALLSGALSVCAQSAQPLPSSAASSPSSATAATGNEVLASCAAAVDDLKQTRILVAALESENAALKKRIETEVRLTVVLTELEASRRSESDTLRSALAAKNESIAAKDAVIAAQDKLIVDLKAKRSSPWKRLGDILIGAAIFAIIK